METLLILGVGLLGLSALLLVLEVFIPSGGILGIGAIFSAIAGIVFLFRYEMIWGATGILSVAVLGPMIFYYAIKILPSTPLGRKMMGRDSEEIARERDQAFESQRTQRAQILGHEGSAITDMRPGGIVEVDGQRYDAVAIGGAIDRGTTIRVTKVGGLSIEVRAAEA